MATTPDYESDFVGWTEHQAGVLKALASRARPGGPQEGLSGLDTENLAEEIADWVDRKSARLPAFCANCSCI